MSSAMKMEITQTDDSNVQIHFPSYGDGDNVNMLIKKTLSNAKINIFMIM